MRRHQRTQAKKPASKSVPQQSSAVESTVVLLEPTHVRLRAWCKEMGYIPGGHFSVNAELPTLETFQKLCKPETIPFWEQLMKRAMPKDKVSAIRQSLAKQALETRTQLERESHKLDVKIDALKKERTDLSDQLVEKRCRKGSVLQRIADDESKIRLLSLKTDQLNEAAAVNDAAVNQMELLRTPCLNNIKEEQGGGDNTLPTQESTCLNTLQDFHNNVLKDFKDVSHMTDLAEFIDKTASKFPAVTIHSGLSTMSHECSVECDQLDNIDYKQANEELKTLQKASGMKTLEESAVALTKQISEMKLHTKQVEHRSNELKQVNEQLRAECLASMNQLADEQLLIRTGDESDVIKAWLDACLELKGTEEKLRVAKTYLDRVPRMNHDRESKYVMTKIELQSLVDESVMLMERLETGIPELLELSAKLVEARSLSVADIADSPITAANIAALDYAMESNVESVRKLVDVPWSSVDSVTLPNGASILRKNLLINRHNVFSDSSDDVDSHQLVRCLDGRQRAEDVLVNFHDKKCRAVGLESAEGNHKVLADKEPEFDFESMKASAESAEHAVNQSLDALEAMKMRVTQRVQDLPMLAALFTDTQIGDLIPASRKVHGKTFQECLALYDAMPSQGETKPTRIKQEK